MSKLYKENGFLSEFGEEVFKERLDNEITKLLNTAKDESSARLIGSLIHKRIGDMVTNWIAAKNEIAAKFNAMEDPEFEAYLKKKYGDHWMLVSLTQEELDRCRPISEKQIRKAMEEVEKCDVAHYSHPPFIRPGLRFK